MAPVVSHQLLINGPFPTLPPLIDYFSQSGTILSVTPTSTDPQRHSHLYQSPAYILFAIMAKLQGTCDSRFKEVEKLFQANLDSGGELGASFVVNIDGENVIDLWGGHADKARTRAWERDTIAIVWSTTKCISALAGLILIDRGLVSPYDKVSKHWPEFAANGKDDVEVRHLLSHTSGLSGWATPLTIEDVLDPAKSTPLLAQQAPWWTPGTASGYHSLTYGHLIGELVRRTTGKSLREFIASDMAGPLGADFQLGAATPDWPRIAETVPPPAFDWPPPGMDPDSVAAKTLGNPAFDPAVANSTIFRNGEAGAANGYASAAGVVRLLSAVSLGGSVDGVKLLSPKTIDLIFQEQAKGMDLAFGAPVRIGIGFGLPWVGSVADWLPAEGRLCFWGGWGGSVGIMDVDRRVTISYVMNKMEHGTFGNDRSRAYVRAVYEALGAYK